jgi:glycerol kinase
MAENAVFVQALADISGLRISIPGSLEVTALGAARAAGIGAGLLRTREEVLAFGPAGSDCATEILSQWSNAQRASARERWSLAIERVKYGT